MKRFEMTVKIDVPTDPFEAAEIIAKARVPWYAMLQTLKDAGVIFEFAQVQVSNRGRNEKQAGKA